VGRGRLLAERLARTTFVAVQKPIVADAGGDYRFIDIAEFLDESTFD